MKHMRDCKPALWGGGVSLGGISACPKGLNASTNAPLPENERKDSILGLYWNAHMASLHAAAVCRAK